MQPRHLGVRGGGGGPGLRSLSGEGRGSGVWLRQPCVSHVVPTVEFPDEIQCVELTLLQNTFCADAHPDKVTESMLCAGYLPGGKDTCMVSQPVPWGLEVPGEGTPILDRASALSRHMSPLLPSAGSLRPLLPPSPFPCISCLPVTLHAFLPQPLASSPLRERFSGEATSEISPEGGRV